MPEIGDVWHPSMPFPETDREKQERKNQGRVERQEKNRAKNAKRKQGKEKQKELPVKRVAAGKHLRHAFGGAFGRAPSNVKFMAGQGTTMDTSEIPRGETKEDDYE